MKYLKKNFFDACVLLLCSTLSLQGLFSTTRLSQLRAIQNRRQNKGLNSPFASNQQIRRYTNAPATEAPKNTSWFGWFKSFLTTKTPDYSVPQQQFFLSGHVVPEPIQQKQEPLLLEQPMYTRVEPEQKFSSADIDRLNSSLKEMTTRMQEEFSTIFTEQENKEEKLSPQQKLRRDEVFAFMEGQLKEAKKYYTHISGQGLSHIFNTLYEHKDVLNEEKDGHTLLGKIILLYGYHLMNDIKDAQLLQLFYIHRAKSVLDFFKEVKKLGASTMTDNDLAEVEKIKEKYAAFLMDRYDGLEDLVCPNDILKMADMFEELKGGMSNFVQQAKKMYLFIDTLDSLIDIELLYRQKHYAFNPTVYQGLIELLKKSVESLFGLESEFYKNFVNKIKEMGEYTDDELNEIKKRRDEIKSELVTVKQAKEWEEWRKYRLSKSTNKNNQQAEQKIAYEKQQQEVYKQEQDRKAAYRKGQPERDRRQIEDEEQLEKEKKQEELRRKEEEAQKARDWYEKQQQEHDHQRREKQERKRQETEEKRRSEEEERYNQEKRSPDDLKVLMGFARIEYVEKLRRHILSISSESTDRQLKSFYKAIIKKLHPDHKGDKEKAQLLNSARSEYLSLKKELANSSSSNELSRE